MCVRRVIARYRDIERQIETDSDRKRHTERDNETGDAGVCVRRVIARYRDT